MKDYFEDLRKNLNEIVDISDTIELKEFTYDLLDCIYVDICCEKDSRIAENLIEAYQNEVKNSIEIFNPEFKNDIDILEKVLRELDLYLES